MAELAQLRAERQQLLAALGRHVADRPWPSVGDVVTINSRWDGPSLYGQDVCLVLDEGDEVRVEHVSGQGWLWGVVDGTGHAGWFGGRGCCATVHIAASVPLGPSGYSSVPPKRPPGAEAETFNAGGSGEVSLDAEVQAYIEKYSIDASAKEALQELGIEDQRKVIDANLMNCRNPSAVLLSRVRACRQGRFSEAGQMGSPAPFVAEARSRSRSPRRAAGPEEVEEFITRHGIDEAAASALRDMPANLQVEVLQADLQNCRRPSAVLMSRIRAVEQRSDPTRMPPSNQGMGYTTPARGYAGQPPYTPPSFAPPAQQAPSQPQVPQHVMAQKVEEFIGRHTLDEAAAGKLREAPPVAQQAIVEMELSNARNPSAVVSSRIQAFRAGGGDGKGQPTTQMSMARATSVEEYIRRFNLDENVGFELRALGPDEQAYIIQTDLVNARNPSAVVASRIREIRHKFGGTLPR